MFVGEAPGAEEEQQGLPFVGPSGKLLEEALFNLQWNKDNVYITNVVKVRPPDNRAPSIDEINSWQPFLFKEVLEVSPLLIITMGATAIRAFDDNRKVTLHNGQLFSMNVLGHKTLVAPVFHPSYVVRGYYKREQWFNTLQKIKYESGV